MTGTPTYPHPYPPLPHDARAKMIEYARMVGKRDFQKYGPLK